MESSVYKSLTPEQMRQKQTAPIPQTTALPVMQVNVKGLDHDGPVVINRADFNPEIHEEVDPKEAEQQQIEALGTEQEGDPVQEYKIYKSFPYQGLFFEKNSQVKLRHSVAKTLSKRFHCIWPVADEDTVNQDSVLRDKLVRGLGGELEERDFGSGPATGGEQKVA